MLLGMDSGNYMYALADLNDPMQVGDLICAMDNARIPFEFDPKVSAKLIRLKDFGKDYDTTSVFKRAVELRKPTVDDNVRELVLRIMEEGVDSETRTGIRSRAVTGAMYTYDLSGGQVPSVSSKFTWNDGVVGELLWMISGDTNIRFLKKLKINIWDSWVKKGTEEFVDGELVAGELPRIYQHQWRGWSDVRVISADDEEAYEKRGFELLGPLDADYKDTGFGMTCIAERKIDQLAKVIDQLKNNPDDRGIILSAWNVGELEEMALRPCHTLCQFISKPMSVRERLVWLGTYKPAGFEHMSEGMLKLAAQHDDRRHEHEFKNDANLREILETAGVPTRKLSSVLYMRSNDIPLGHPFNIVQYSVLTHMIAQVTGQAADTFTYMGGDCHIYEDQWPAVLEWMNKPAAVGSHPTIQLNPNIKDLFEFGVDDVKIVGYKHSGKVKFPKAAV
jgi:thymidylate synthase